MSIRWSGPAHEDLVGIVAYIQEDDPAMAETVGRRILKATEQLSAFPGSGPPGRIEGTREKLVLGMPYIFVYRAAPTGGHVEILRVMHARKDRDHGNDPHEFEMLDWIEEVSDTEGWK